MHHESKFKSGLITLVIALVLVLALLPASVLADNDFSDVIPGEFYEDAVNWAVSKDVTSGMYESYFGTFENCTRAQMVTFLWRVAGSPETDTSTITNKFVDLDTTQFYMQPIAWAVENGITNGVDENTFAPDAVITRAQTVTFLSRFAILRGVNLSKTTDANAVSAFNDLEPGQFYLTAVAWATTADITNGVGTNKFGPDDKCTRGQVVTFLYRYCSTEDALVILSDSDDLSLETDPQGPTIIIDPEESDKYSDLRQQVVDYACLFVGNPYKHAGNSLTNGTDCSGFCKLVYEHFGYSISRSSKDIRKNGIEVSYADALPGDIICYNGHVAMYMGNGDIVHASGYTRGIVIDHNPFFMNVITIRRIIY